MNTSDDEYASSHSAGRPSPPRRASPRRASEQAKWEKEALCRVASDDSIYKSSVNDLEDELAEYKEDKQPYDQVAAPAAPAPRAWWCNPPPPLPEFNDDPLTWGFNDVRPGWE